MEMENQKYLLWVFYCFWNQIYLDAHCFENGNVAKCQNTSALCFISSCPEARIVPYIVRTIYHCEVLCFIFTFQTKLKFQHPPQPPVFNYVKCISIFVWSHQFPQSSIHVSWHHSGVHIFHHCLLWSIFYGKWNPIGVVCGHETFLWNWLLNPTCSSWHL